jgi:hypothetical protein
MVSPFDKNSRVEALSVRRFNEFELHLSEGKKKNAKKGFPFQIHTSKREDAGEKK